MNPELRSLLERGGGLVTRAQAAQVVPVWAVENACRRGQLHRVLPGVYRDAATFATPILLRRSALAWLDGRGALSHTTALAEWGLHEPAPAEPVHLTVPATVRLRPHPGFEVHRWSPFLPEPPYAVARGGLLVTRLERSLVTSTCLGGVSYWKRDFDQAEPARAATVASLCSLLVELPRSVRATPSGTGRMGHFRRGEHPTGRRDGRVAAGQDVPQRLR